MSEVYKYYLQLVEKIRDLINNKFSDGMEKKLDLRGYTPEKQKEMLKLHKDDLRKKTINSLNEIKPEIEKMISSTSSDRRMARFPGLYSSEDSKKQLALSEQNNALMLFQSSWPNGNIDGLLNSLKDAIDSKRYVFASTIIDQIKNSDASLFAQFELKKQLESIETDYDKTIGLDVYDEKRRILDYADKLNQASKILVERSEISGDERFYLPEYGSKDFQDKMTLADISIKTGIEFDTESTSESVASAAAE